MRDSDEQLAALRISFRLNDVHAGTIQPLVERLEARGYSPGSAEKLDGSPLFARQESLSGLLRRDVTGSPVSRPQRGRAAGAE